jgi:hypothetical protein
LFFGEGDHDQVADRDAEVLLVNGPRTDASDVLGAQHAEAVIVGLERDVEHRADVVRDEITVAKFTGARVGLRIVRRDDPLAPDGVEVAGAIARGNTAPDS